MRRRKTLERPTPTQKASKREPVQCIRCNLMLRPENHGPLCVLCEEICARERSAQIAADPTGDPPQFKGHCCVCETVLKPGSTSLFCRTCQETRELPNIDSSRTEVPDDDAEQVLKRIYDGQCEASTDSITWVPSNSDRCPHTAAVRGVLGCTCPFDTIVADCPYLPEICPPKKFADLERDLHDLGY